MMKMKTGKLLLILNMVGFVCMATGTAISGSKDTTHNIADLNNDGMVTSEELENYVRIHFLKMDKKNDHIVDNSEWEKEWWQDGYYD